MKNVLLVILLTTSVVFAALYFRQAEQIGQRETKIGELQARLKEREAEAAKATIETAAARGESETLRAKLNEIALAEQARQAAQSKSQSAAAKTNAAAGKGGKGFAEMFSSPEMKDMMKNQQKLVLGPMVDKLFGPFFAQLQMNDEQKGYLKDLLLKKMLVGAESGLDLLNPDLDPAKRQEITAKIKRDTATYDAQIKDYLGEQYYPEFQQYEKTQGERLQLDQFREQLAAGSTPLSAGQQEQLMQAMAQQKESFRWTLDYSDQSKVSANMSDYFTEEKMAKFADEKLRYDQEMLARAQAILSAEQYTAYEKFVTAQRQLQVAGMKMAAQMFGTKK